MQRPLKIGEARKLDHRGQTARTRNGGPAPSVYTECIVAGTQLAKLKALCNDPVTDAHALDLAGKAAREIRLAATRAGAAIESMKVALAIEDERRKAAAS